MELFRTHGLITPEPYSGLRAGYRGARRRYGRLRADGMSRTARPVDTERAEDTPFPWVDQEFEEYFFE